MIAVAAPAKINLTLHVVGRRADGYHLLDSLVAFASLHDVVTTRPADALSLAVAGPMAGALAATPPEDNLIVRAARALAAAGGLAAPCAALTLDKRLPVAGGIGGGSADAAAALLALRALWRLDVSDERLAEIGLALGADVPACLASRPSRMSGIGETLAPLPALPALGVLLVNPGVALPTARVFGALNGRFGAPGPMLDRAMDASALLDTLRRGRNDLETPAMKVAPVIGAALAALADLPGARLARMSGSGATCFALFDDAQAARTAARRLGEAHADWWCAAGHLIDARDQIAL